jgi:hypothetical protein
MTEREEQEIVDLLQQEPVASDDALNGVPAEVAPCSPVPAERYQGEGDEELAHETDGPRQADLKDVSMDIHAPAELNRRVAELRPGFFNFTTTAWDSALSSNTLNFMERKERDRWVSAYGGIEMYQKISMTGALPSFNDVITYFPSHRSYASDAVEAEAERKLRALRNEFAILDVGLGADQPGY